MKIAQLTLRLEEPADYAAVETMTRDAFWNLYSPGCEEHYLVRRLRAEACYLPELDVVAEAEGQIVGHILYTRAHILMDAGGSLPVLSFGPLTVRPDCQRQGVGSALIRHTLALARAQGHIAVLIYGDPAYYGRQGFVPAEQFGIGSPDGMYRAALQAYPLQPEALTHAAGVLEVDPAHTLDPEAAEAFDRDFPPREKKSGLASQVRFQEVVAMARPMEPQSGGRARGPACAFR